MQSEKLERLARLQANLLQSIEENTGESLWERNSLWANTMKEVFDLAGKLWAEVLGDTLKKSFQNRDDFPSADATVIIGWMDLRLDAKGKNPHDFWDNFVSNNKKLLDKVTRKLFSIEASISFYCSSDYRKYRNAALYLHNDINGEQEEKNKKKALQEFLENPHFILEKELETLVVFYSKIVDGKSFQNEEDIKELYHERVKFYFADKDQSVKNHRRKSVDKMLKQLEWQQYCGDESRIEKAMAKVKNNRVLTLLGIGGLGKTALATEIVRRYLKTNDYDYFPFITSKSSEQGHYTFSKRIERSNPEDRKIHPGTVNTNDFQVLINTLLEIDDTKSQTEKNRLTDKQKKDIVFALFKDKKILCVIDNYEDIERDNIQREKYAELIEFLMENETQSRIIITARESELGVKEMVDYLNNKEIKNLLQERIKWYGESAQEIVNIQEYLRVIYEKIDKLKQKEFEVWGHPYIILYLAWMISNKEDPKLLAERIINDEDEIVMNIAAYCVDKTLDNLNPNVKEYIEYVCKRSDAEFTRKDMEEWFLGFKDKQLATEEREDFLRQLKGGANVTEKIRYDNVSVFEVTQLTQTRLNPNREIYVVPKDKKQDSDKSKKSKEWIDSLEEFVNDPHANPSFIDLVKWDKQVTVISTPMTRKIDESELQDVNVIRTKRLIKLLYNREDVNIDRSHLETMMIQLMNYENKYTNSIIDIVDNILEICSYKFLDDEIKIECSSSWLEVLDNRHKKRDNISIYFNQETTQKIVNALELIYEINSWNPESNINSERDLIIMETWFDWLNYVAKQNEFLFLPDKDVVNWKTSVVAYVLQKEVQDEKYEQWLTKSLGFLTDDELKKLIRNVITRQTYSFEQLESEIKNNQKILPYTQAYVSINGQPSLNKNNQLSCILIFDRDDTSAKCKLTINGFVKKDVIDSQNLYLVKFENTEFLSSISCNVARDYNENLIVKTQVANLEPLSKNSATKLLKDLFLSKIEPEGALHELVFKVSISEEITSSPFSFIEVKKAAGFGKSVKAAIFVKKLLGDQFTVLAGNDKARQRYAWGSEAIPNMVNLDDIINPKPLQHKALPNKKEIGILFEFIKWFVDWVPEFLQQCENGEFDKDAWKIMQKNEINNLDLNSIKRSFINFGLKRITQKHAEEDWTIEITEEKVISEFKELYHVRLNYHYPDRKSDVEAMVSELFESSNK